MFDILKAGKSQAKISDKNFLCQAARDWARIAEVPDDQIIEDDELTAISFNIDQGAQDQCSGIIYVNKKHSSLKICTLFGHLPVPSQKIVQVQELIFRANQTDDSLGFFTLSPEDSPTNERTILYCNLVYLGDEFFSSIKPGYVDFLVCVGIKRLQNLYDEFTEILSD